MQEDLLAVVESKNPSVKEETIRFLVRCFSKSTPAALPKTFLKPVCSSLLKVRAYKMFYVDLFMKHYSQKNANKRPTSPLGLFRHLSIL